MTQFLQPINQIYSHMDLQYPSHGNVDIIKQLNRLDKLTSKLNLTLKDMPINECLNKSQKENIIKMISRDKHTQLVKYLLKEVIGYDKQIGAKSTRWNVLHVCAKYDAVNSMKIILKQLFQQDRQEYMRIINSQSIQGYTPLMITIIYQSQKTLELLLQLGGSDLYIIQASKQRAYDLAINYHNQKAIQELIRYEDQCKKKMFLNEKELVQVEQDEEEKSWCSNVANYLIDCLLCFNRDQMFDGENDHNFLKKLGNMIGSELDQKQNLIDEVKIGSRRDIEDYEIDWKRLSSLNGQKFILFDSFKPLDISESQFSLRHNLIIFQALSDYSWIIKRAISKFQDKSKDKSRVSQQNELQKYMVTLYKNYSALKLMVDECVPVIKERGQVMFLSNPNQIWPMLLQKALAKIYNSYIQLNNINPADVLEEMTGFYTKSIPLTALTNQANYVAKLQELTFKGYLILLEGRESTDLNSSNQTNSYSILNYYEKGNVKKILVNCPNLVQKWKQPKENRQLAIIKAHFNKHNQSCVWIDESKLDYYFKNVIVCFLKENYLRNQLKIRMKIKNQFDQTSKVISDQSGNIVKQYKKSIFIKFKVQTQRDEPILLQLIDLQTKNKYDLRYLQGWRNEGSQPLVFTNEVQNCNELVKLQCQPGQYTCMFQIKEKKTVRKNSLNAESKGSIMKAKKEQDEESFSLTEDNQNKANKIELADQKKKVKLNLGPEHLKELMLINWSIDQIQIQYIEQQFGTIEWLSHFKNYSMMNWNSLMKKMNKQCGGTEQCFIYETVNNKTMLLIRKPKVKNAFLQFKDSPQSNLPMWGISSSIIEGKLQSAGQSSSVSLMREQSNPNFFYMVANNFPIELFDRQQRMQFIYEYE